MTCTHLSCRGIMVASIWIPPFQLRAGDFLCLHMPCLAFSKEEEQIVCVLTGGCPVAGLRLFSHICRASAPVSRGGILGLFRRPRVVDWIRRSGGISRMEARAIMARLGLRPDWRVCQLAMTPRTLLGLEAAWARGAEVVVFTTVGCDPLGRKAVYEAVSARLHHCAALHLSYSFIQNGRPGRDCFTRGSCIELRRQSDSPVSQISSQDQG
jgi:hypothetical protein